jgi:hypothetical protein
VKYQKASDDNTIKSLVSQTLTECKTLAHYINVRVAVTQSKACERRPKSRHSFLIFLKNTVCKKLVFFLSQTHYVKTVERKERSEVK